ncbi:sensor histidine kinase [Anaeromicropila herbilytica]|uniref:histidine kinase n=1 Tax=Anaeromicropila herbilytica TaxID=2785025 RepID=A0A7R7EGR8_9FIRM|nr:HAMP domain-containing sensor histidine kinase [Anaeromicropila herbilytica]BCN28915.1 two-component sensor histidine kinase [Anaeromicropila herbilytica]
MIGKNTYVIVVMAVIILILMLVIIGQFIYNTKRKKKSMMQIQEMIDSAMDGSFEQRHFDETRLSSIENSMWRFLKDSRLSSTTLAEQKKKIQTLISDISHQTVTPIANIMLYSELLEEKQKKIKVQSFQPDGNIDDETTLDEIAAIREQTSKLDFLIQSLVKLSRLENGIITVNVKKDKIQSVLTAIESQMSAKANQKRIEFLVANSEETAVFDAKWTVEALVNIVDNALKYTPAGGQVSVSVEPYTIFLKIDISDNGIGIAEEEQAKIFTRFYRSIQVSDSEGVGVGLYLAREVISAQKGYIKVQSKINEGTTFSVFLLRE